MSLYYTIPRPLELTSFVTSLVRPKCQKEARELRTRAPFAVKKPLVISCLIKHRPLTTATFFRFDASSPLIETY